MSTTLGNPKVKEWWIASGSIRRKMDPTSDTNNKIFKARLVTKGFTQRKYVDYNEVFALVEMDVVTTFLYGLLDEVIFMRQSQGFLMKGK
jgi:hypothetical protein